MTWSSARTRRIRPLLGTFVEIRLDPGGRGDGPGDIDAAFAEIEAVHRLMSWHEPGSDVSRLNREAAHHPVRVDARTWNVLCLAREMSEASRGLFDVTVEPWLRRFGILPGEVGDELFAATRGDYRDIELLSGRRVRFTRPLRLCLDGIAKGYAVDRAVECLRGRGARAGAVNAGGDLRVFGPRPQPLHLRDPRDACRLLPLPPLRNEAAATSAACFARSGTNCNPILDPRSKAPAPARSVTVIARRCAVADALTKVVALLPKPGGCLERFNARALVLEPETAAPA
ncbi:MAG TPA: FAD:protein FMN transferase [Burkholderiales bacterium]